MKLASKIRFGIYLGLSLVGLVTAMYFNYLAVTTGEDYGKAWTLSAADMVLTSDLAIVAIAAGMFMITEGRRIGMKRSWIYLVLSGFTAMAFTFPLFLAMRERQLATKSG